MAEENIDLSSFDEIPDRVARAKAKAEAMRKAREAQAKAEPEAEAPEAEAPEAEAEASAEAPEEGGGEVEADLSSLDDIPDRVARAKAKAEAMRRARAEGGVAPAKKAAVKKTAAKKAPAKKAAGAAGRAAAARALTGSGEGGEERVVVQTTPAPPAIRPGPERMQPVAEGGITTRRGFFSWLALAWVAFATAMTAGLAAAGRFMFPNVLFEPPQSFKVGMPEEFDIGVDERFKDKFGVWVVRNSDGMYVLISVCTHLGCTPNWLVNEQKFKCPCHGSGFYPSGINFEGPAPRPLERARIVLADDGQVVVDKTQKYQYEKGQWDNPESFLRV